MFRNIYLSFIFLILIGCAATKPVQPTLEFAPVMPVDNSQMKVADGSIYEASEKWTWFGRKRDYQVGDVITVILDESTQAQRTQELDVSRQSENDVMTDGMANALRPKIGGSLFRDFSFDGNTIESTGEGDAAQSAALNGSIAATVVQKLSNGNLVIKGEKQLELTEGTETIRVSGVIRSEDVSPNNTVLSKRIANSQITYVGTGDLANASKPGWGTRLFHKYWPF